MTLTNDDLYAIGNLIDQKLDQKLEPIKKELNDVKKMTIKIDKKTTKIVNSLDKDVMKVTKRVDHIQSVLHIPRSYD